MKKSWGSLSRGGFAATLSLPFTGQVALNISINVTPLGWSDCWLLSALSAAVTSRCGA